MKRRWQIVSILVLLTFGSAFAEPLPINQLPMYGERKKSEVMKKADAEFLASFEKKGLIREEGAQKVIKVGWSYWAKQDISTAMMRFNQGWLLDPENGNAYHGFALVTSVRGGSSAEVERLFLLAVSKAKVDPEAYVDYGRFLWTQKKLDKSMVQLKKSLQLSSTTRNARSNISFVHYLKGDFGSACNWAKDARKNGDELENGFLEEMCSRAGKS